MKTTDILIVGAGVTGLSAAYHLEQNGKRDYLVLEKDASVGGLCKSVMKDGFLFDYGGHVLHLKEKYTLDLVKKLLGKNINFIKREAWIYTHGAKVPFPFQSNLFYLKKEIVDECIQGLLAAPKIKNPATFKDWCLTNYGAGISKYFMFPYNEKLWQCPAGKLTTAWCNTFVPATEREDIIKGAYHENKKDYGYNKTFFYPKHFAAAALPNALVDKIQNIQTRTEVKAIDLDKKTVRTNKGVFKYNKLITTMPLKTLAQISGGLSAGLKAEAKKLKTNTVYIFNIGINRVIKHVSWIYMPDSEQVFYRAGVQTNFSANVAPKNCSSLYIEVAVPEGKKIHQANLEKKILAQLKELGVLKETDKVLAKTWLTIPQAYVTYDAHRETAVPALLSAFKEKDVYSAGRYGAWEYSFMEKNLLEGLSLAKLLK